MGCTDAQKTACKASLDGLAECPAPSSSTSLRSFFNSDTCCMSCKRPARASQAKCTKEDFKTCIDTARECEASEKPLKEKGQCCVSCRRPARDAPLRDVGKCGDIPECAADEAPSRVKDDSGAFACPTCRKPKPVCESACGTGKMCVRSKGGESTSCKSKKAKKLKMRAKTAVDKAFLKAATASETKAVLQEVVKRFCDKAQDDDKCDRFEDVLTEQMEVKLVAAKGGSSDETEVQVDVPTVVEERLRRLAEDAGSLLDAAMADTDATGDMEISRTLSSDANNASGTKGSPKPRCEREKMAAIAACAEGIKPTKTDDGCPSCRPK